MGIGRTARLVPVLAAEEKTAALTLLPDAEKTVWKYFQNWSLGRMENGVYRSLFITGRLGEGEPYDSPGSWRLPYSDGQTGCQAEIFSESGMISA